MVTFRLTVDQFQRLLTVMLADDTPDHLSDLVLLACTRPHEGIISVPVPPEAAVAIAAAVTSGAERDTTFLDLAALMGTQLAAQT